MKKTTFTTNRRGFTLVEILVVLLIIAILSGGIAFLSSDNSSSVMANKIVSEIRTMKSASIMYRRDHGMIAAGTPVSVLKPYMGSSIENSEVSYSFVFDENGQAFLQADLSELDGKIKQKIADLADQNLFLKPGEESASLQENNPLFAQFNLKNVIGYFTATPAYAGKGNGWGYGENGNGGKGNAHGRGWFDDFLEDLFGDDEDDQNTGPGDDPDDGDDANGEDDFDDIDENDDGDYEDDLDDDEDYSDYEENDPYEPPHGTPGEGTGNDQQENTETSTGSVSSEGKYSGGDLLLIRI